MAKTQENFTCVNSPVFLKVDCRPEASLADLALVVPHPCVDLVVDGQRVFPGKLFSAELALERFLVGVDGGVVVAQVGVLAEVAAALLTLERLFSFKRKNSF